MDIKTRFEIALLVRGTYQSFEHFARDAMSYLGFDITDMQADIAAYMQKGPRLRMVMAQRGEAKSTLAAIYAVWCLIQDPTHRILIVSAAEDKASEVASIIIKLILHWDILAYLRPDRSAGDRTSAGSFDVHYALKGIDQSPSVACIGITASLQGRRADLLVPDDIESTKNALTVTQRGHLLALTREFTSINTHGDIMYLGTPQTRDSVYNTLPGRGFDIRIWPGRVPSDEQIVGYGELLAPFVMAMCTPENQTGYGLSGLLGKPTDPDRFDEDALIEKELDQGPEGFQLQYMLDTSLSDAIRQQLKLGDFLVADFDYERVPEVIARSTNKDYELTIPEGFPVPRVKMYNAVVPSRVAWVPAPKDRLMYIDPAGGGGDEIGFAVTFAVGPFIHVMDVGGLTGGLIQENSDILIEVIKELSVSRILVESNMGHGLFEINLRAALETAGLKVPVTGEYSTGQKERRIIDSMVSALQRHRIVLHKRVFDSDRKYGLRHNAANRSNFSVFHQLHNITTDRDSLVHDDRLEALAGAIRMHKHALAVDADKAAEARKVQEALEFMKNPMGHDTNPKTKSRGTRAVARRRRYK